MDIRKQKLLNLVVENYINSAEPVASRFLVSESGLGVQEATMRNELRALEKEGYLTHPHTSAGRIPTEKGYKFYINNLDLSSVKISKKDCVALEVSLQENQDYEVSRKHLAKAIVELSQEAIILAFSLEKVYYTGLSNLFNKPEFNELRLVADVTAVFDRCEECLEDFYDKVEDEPQYFIGAEHPFGNMLSVLSARFGRRNDSLIALLGPQRMDYRYNYGLMRRVMEII